MLSVICILLFGIYAKYEQGQAVAAKETARAHQKDAEKQKEFAELQRKDADFHKGKAFELAEVAETIAAKSVLLPLHVHAADQVSNFEFSSLLGLASSDNEVLRLTVFKAGLRDAKFCRRISGRAKVLLHAAIGLSEERHENIRQVVTDSVRKLLDRKQKQCPILHAHCALIRELGGIENPLQEEFEQYLVAQINVDKQLNIRRRMLQDIHALLQETDPTLNVVSHSALKPVSGRSSNEFAGLSSRQANDLISSAKDDSLARQLKLASSLCVADRNFLKTPDSRANADDFIASAYTAVKIELGTRQAKGTSNLDEQILTELLQQLIPPAPLLSPTNDVESLSADLKELRKRIANGSPSEGIKTQICDKYYMAMWRAKAPWSVAVIGSVCAAFLPPGDVMNRDRVIDKLSLWLYQLPSDADPGLSESLGDSLRRCFEQPQDLSTKGGMMIHKRRIRSAHAIMRAKFRDDHSNDGDAGEAATQSFREIIAGLQPDELLSLLKTPYCSISSQETILRTLGVNVDGSAHSLQQLANEVKRRHQLTDDQLTCGVHFNGAVFFDQELSDLVRDDHAFVYPPENIPEEGNPPRTAGQSK